MDKWTRALIIVLSLPISAMSFYIAKLSYEVGFYKGQVTALTTFTDDADGYCLADTPSHKGKCHDDTNVKISKRH